MFSTVERAGRPAQPMPPPMSRRAGAPAPELGPMSRPLAHWVATDARLGRSYLCNVEAYSDLQLRERLHALRQATALQKRVMQAWPVPWPSEQALIEAGMLVRRDEALRVEHALKCRAGLRATGRQWADAERPAPRTVDEPPLREAALCLMSNEELMQRLSHLRRALSAWSPAPHGTGPQPGAGAARAAQAQARTARYEQQADVLIEILRKRGINLR